MTITDTVTTCLVCGAPCNGDRSARWMEGGALCEAHFPLVVDACHHISMQGFRKDDAELLAVEVVMLGGTVDIPHHSHRGDILTMEEEELLF